MPWGIKIVNVRPSGRNREPGWMHGGWWNVLTNVAGQRARTTNDYGVNTPLQTTV